MRITLTQAAKAHGRNRPTRCTSHRTRIWLRKTSRLVGAAMRKDLVERFMDDANWMPTI